VPGADHDLTRGANCQRFAYAFLAEHGVAVPPLRSAELWADGVVSRRATVFEPLDLLLFNRTADAYGAHVAVYLGEGEALHLGKAAGLPEVWSMARFQADPRYRCFIGAKRVITGAFHE
jgi:hypothetical protein